MPTINTLRLIIVLTFCVLLQSKAQDIPLFSQKLSNALIYNPSVAGNTFGSVTYTYRKNYFNVKGAPQSNLISLHTPLVNYRFGVGATAYQEQINFIKTSYTSVAFAYHIHFNRYASLSSGVSAEYRLTQLDGRSNTLYDDPDLVTINNANNFDVSFGMNFQNRFIRVGVAANRLATTWVNKENPALGSGFFSGTVHGIIPIGADDVLEPYMAFRKFSEINDMYDVGLYYTLRNKFIFGAASRNKIGGGGNTILNGTLGFKPTKNILLGYSYEIITGGVGNYAGATNEFTLRLDFNNKSYKEKFRRDYLDALSYRRKPLSKNPVGTKNPKQLHRKQKSMKMFSPNTRYQNINKVSKKHKKVKGKSFKKRKSVLKSLRYNPRKKR